MAIENFKEVQDYIEQNKETDDVKNYIGGFITPDRVNSFFETEDGKKLLQPKLDSYATKAITSHDEKFKVNELPKLINEEMKKRFPDADPKDTELADMKAEIEKMKQETLHKDLTNKALQMAQERKLPSNLINYFVGNDEETTKTNLEALEKEFNANVQAQVEERLKGGYKPPKDNTTLTAEQQAQEQINKLFGIKTNK